MLLEPPDIVVTSRHLIPEALYTKHGADSENIRKTLKSKRPSGLHEIPKIWETKQFKDINLNLCNVFYNQTNIETWTNRCILPIQRRSWNGKKRKKEKLEE